MSYKPSRNGFINYSDLATQSSPIVYTTGSPLKLTNDGAGAQTLKTYKPQGISEFWNTSTNRFDFTGLVLGDEIRLRVNLTVTTSATNQTFLLYLSMAIGGVAYSLYDGNWYFKTAGSYQVGVDISIYIGNTDTITYPAELMFSSDANAQIKVNGFYISALRK